MMNKQLRGEGTAQDDREANWLTCLRADLEFPIRQFSYHLSQSAPWNSNSVMNGKLKGSSKV